MSALNIVGLEFYSTITLDKQLMSTSQGNHTIALTEIKFNMGKTFE